jgi:hypothetical protein
VHQKTEGDCDKGDEEGAEEAGARKVEERVVRVEEVWVGAEGEKCDTEIWWCLLRVGCGSIALLLTSCVLVGNGFYCTPRTP